MASTSIVSGYLLVDGIRTHYLEAGMGPTVVLLHSGEYGGAAELSWELNIPALARLFHVVAPDWLGYGLTDKVYDFADPRGRAYRHLRRFLDLRGISRADFIGNSMGASNLLDIASRPDPILPMRSMVIASGGGFVPLTPERRTLLAYDGTPAAMGALLRAMMHDPKWGDDPGYVARRQAFALMPGAWQCASASRLRLPGSEEKSGFGRPDDTPYENISVPTLIVAGAEDRLRERGYATEIGKQIRECEVHVLEDCGHCPNIEKAELFNDLAIRFLKRVHTGRH